MLLTPSATAISEEMEDLLSLLGSSQLQDAATLAGTLADKLFGLQQEALAMLDEPSDSSSTLAPMSEVVEALHRRSEEVTRELESESLSGTKRQSLVAERIKLEKEIVARKRQAELTQLLNSDVLSKLIERLWGAETSQVERNAKKKALASAERQIADIFSDKQGRQQLAHSLIEFATKSAAMPPLGFRGCCELVNSALSSMVNSEPPIFDEIVLCALDSKGPRLCSHMTSAMLRGTENTTVEQRDIPRGVEHMCFPVGLASTPVLPEQYTIVRTLDDGTRQYGFSAVLRSSEHEESEPGFVASLPGGKGFKCLCIFSRHTWFSLFHDLMASVAAAASVEAADHPDMIPPAVVCVLQGLLHTVDAAFPMPGERFTVEVPGQASLHLTRADDESAPLIDVDFLQLFDAVGVVGVLEIYKHLMFEGHVVFTSSNMSKLCACSLASLGLLYPFRWQHFFVPNLPVGMLDYVTAPMPFCLGLHSSLLDAALKLPIEESLVVVKLDDSEILVVGSGETTDSVGELPHSLVDRLDKAFTKLHKDWRQGRLDPSQFNRLILEEIVNIMVGLLCDYREYVGDDSANAFDIQRLIDSYSGEEDTQDFFRSLQATQAFDVWTQDCVTLKAEGFPRRGFFETGVSDRNFVEDSSGTTNVDVSTARKLVDVSTVLRSEERLAVGADASVECAGGMLVDHIRSHEVWKNLTRWDRYDCDSTCQSILRQRPHSVGCVRVVAAATAGTAERRL